MGAGRDGTHPLRGVPVVPPSLGFFRIGEIMKIEFDVALPVGTLLSIEGQSFRLISFEQHTKRNGEGSVLAGWTSHCSDCGGAFLTRTPEKQLPESKRCELHRKPGKRARFSKTLDLYDDEAA